jgi:hypothetical protein
MTATDIRIAMAQLDGWTHCRPWKRDVLAVGRPRLCVAPEGQLFGLPWYTSDRDAIIRVLEAIDPHHRLMAACFIHRLVGINREDEGLIVAAMMATPLQWCEAILRAVGRWKN